MIMAIPPYVSLLSNGSSYSCSAPAKDDCTASDLSRPRNPEVTAMPKKRSFDVAFLISQDDKPKEEKVAIRSAFRKVGIGLTTFPSPDSRSQSPIDPIRTPSPYDLCLPLRKEARRDVPRSREDTCKSPLYLGTSLVSHVGLNRGSFLPSPIFGPSPTLLPTSFVTAASLLPPSLAALTLPAQNVCAKCNVSFRMTSDLVYHMRSHHKHDGTTIDQLRRRRDLDKLKCPVCNESFRERHHLTRHMTAHQDKEGDNVVLGSSRSKTDYDH